MTSLFPFSYFFTQVILREVIVALRLQLETVTKTFGVDVTAQRT